VGRCRQEIGARRLFGFAKVVSDRHLIAAAVVLHSDPEILTSEQELDYRVGGDREAHPAQRNCSASEVPCAG
jgi:hypothetical protein